MRVRSALCTVPVVRLPAAMADAPRLRDYPASDIFRGTPAAPVLATKEARMFRTELRRQAALGPKFAGHYTLALWGCGAGCANGAVIDARSGEVWFIPFSWDDEWKDGQIICAHGSTFDISSELLVVERGQAGKHYFRWHNGKFSLVYFDAECSVKPPGP